jgi:hypothetical protein
VTTVLFKILVWRSKLAAACEHPDSRWLSKVFDGKDVKTKDEARAVFLGLGGANAKALCFAWRLCSDDFSELRHAALEGGDAFAQGFLAGHSYGEERFRLATLSAAQGERIGHHALGFCYQVGHGVEKDLEKAREQFKVSVSLGLWHSFGCVAELLPKSQDLQRWRMYGQVALKGLSGWFVESLSLRVHDEGPPPVVFMIGRYLKQGGVDPVAKTIFNMHNWMDFPVDVFDVAEKALAFYSFQLCSYRKAVDSWTLVGIRFHVVKDVRILIAKLIWDSREEAVYQMILKND